MSYLFYVSMWGTLWGIKNKITHTETYNIIILWKILPSPSYLCGNGGNLKQIIQTMSKNSQTVIEIVCICHINNVFSSAVPSGSGAFLMPSCMLWPMFVWSTYRKSYMIFQLTLWPLALDYLWRSQTFQAVVSHKWWIVWSKFVWNTYI